MPNYCKVIIEGRATKDAEAMISRSGVPLASVGIAVNRRVKQGDHGMTDEVSFFDVVAFGSKAERLARAKKGNELFLHGRLKQRRWESADGQKQSKVEIIADYIMILQQTSVEEPECQEIEI